MNQGFYLTLMMGGFNASPVPQAVIDSLQEVQVTSTVGAQGGFQLKFSISRNSPLAQLHNSGFFDPRKRVIIAVTVNGATEVLIDGIVTKQDMVPSSQAGKSTLSVTGLDLTALMDFIDLTGIPYPALPPFVIVDLILAKYAPLGVYPVAIPNAIPSLKNPLDGWVTQHGTDYAYIQELGQTTGWTFYLDPGPSPGTSMAYWGPDLSSMFGGTQSPPLLIDMGSATNIDSISFSYDGMLATQYLMVILEDETDPAIPIPVPVPNIAFLKGANARNAATPLKSEQGPKPENDDKSSSNSVVDALVWGVKKLFATSEAVTANGQLDVVRYGQVFKARKQAVVQGAGDYYDGKYYVKSVTHNIKNGEYKQSFSLARGGTGSTV
jgi:hypothetical protein